MSRPPLAPALVTGLVAGLLVLSGCASRGGRRSRAPEPVVSAEEAREDSLREATGRAGEVEPAEETLSPEEAAELARTDYARGTFLAQEKRAAEALPYLREAARLAPERPEVSYNLGLAELAAGDSTAAVMSLRRAVSLAPEESDYHRGLGTALARCGFLEEAVGELARAATLNPGSAEIRYALAEVRERSGDRRGAAKEWRAFLAMNPRGPWADEARRRLGALEETPQASPP